MLRRQPARKKPKIEIIEISSGKKAEERLRRRDAILEAVSFMAQKLMNNKLEECLRDVLSRLGSAAGASRVDIYRNYPEENTIALLEQWVSEEFAPDSGEPYYGKLNWLELGYARWADVLKQKKVVSGNLEDFPENERIFLEALNVKSTLAVPVFVSNQPWGFISFDDCASRREWTSAEVDALTIAGGIVAAAIEHDQARAVIQEEIVEHKIAENALKEKEEFLRNLFDNMLDAILILDWDGTILFGNNAAAALVGFAAPREGIGRNFVEFIHPDSLERAVRNLMLARQDKGKFLDEHVIISAKGERKIVEAIGRKITFQGKTADIIGLRDITMRRKAEEALRESEDVFRVLVSNMLDCLLIIDPDGYIIFANEAALKLGEMDSMQEVIGKRIDRFLSRPDSKKAFRFLRKRYLDFVYEFRIRTGKGKEKYIETLGNPIRFKGKQAVILNLRDITERKKSEQKLLEAYGSLQVEIREREEAEKALDDYRVHLEVMVGERTAELKKANRMLEMEVSERQKSEQKIKDLNMLLLSTKRITESLLRANTEEELFQTTCGLLAELDFIELVWAGFTDEEHFNVKPVAWSGREDGYLSSVKITWDNSEYGGGPTGTAIRTGWISTVMDIETDPSFGPWREEALKRGYRSAIALPISSREEIIGYLTVYSGARDAFGIEEIEFLTQIAEDIAVGVKSLRMERELESKHQEIQKAYAELKASEEMVIQQEKLASIGQLAAGIAHEIKNPLAIVLQGTEYMKSCVDDEFLADAAERIKNSVNRADDIIKGLLSFSRQAGIDLKLGHISEVLNESVALVSHQLTRKNIRVVREFASVQPIKFDRNQMKQVFINLLLNAIESMEPWGEIKIELADSPERANEIMIKLTDNGCGMNKETVSRIFDPFFTTKRNSGGTGLGMSITKGIIEKHNGRISVESAVGAGTQVSIYLPQGAVH